MRKFFDKSYPIGHEHFGPRVRIQGPDRGIECGEQLIGHEHIDARHRAQQRGFAGIGVPDERDRQFVFPSRAARLMLVPDRRQFRPEFLQAIADSALIELKTRLS
ncbi:MAG: hypothetical protein JW395_0844 [Nitrospira sp.]|nr:hypothetical protein [Nitrospira sp.]